MFNIPAGCNLFGTCPDVFKYFNLSFCVIAICKLSCKLCKSHWMKDICHFLLQVSGHCIQGIWQIFLLTLAHLEEKVLHLPKKTVSLAGYYTSYHSSLVVVVQHPVIGLDVQDGTGDWLVSLPELLDLIL